MGIVTIVIIHMHASGNVRSLLCPRRTNNGYSSDEYLWGILWREPEQSELQKLIAMATVRLAHLMVHAVIRTKEDTSTRWNLLSITILIGLL